MASSSGRPAGPGRGPSRPIVPRRLRASAGLPAAHPGGPPYRRQQLQGGPGVVGAKHLVALVSQQQSHQFKAHGIIIDQKNLVPGLDSSRPGYQGGCLLNGYLSQLKAFCAKRHSEVLPEYTEVTYGENAAIKEGLNQRPAPGGCDGKCSRVFAMASDDDSGNNWRNCQPGSRLSKQRCRVGARRGPA
jgi:hypothetical protein